MVLVKSPWADVKNIFGSIARFSYRRRRSIQARGGYSREWNPTSNESRHRRIAREYGPLTDVWTIRSSPGEVVAEARHENYEILPLMRAAIPMIISTAFPKEAFNKPDKVCPSLTDSWSVASPRSCNTYQTWMPCLGIGATPLREE